MNSLNMRRGFAALFLIAQLLVSCKSIVTVDENINKNAPFFLTDKRLNKNTVDEKSDKHARIVGWITNNTENWDSTIASYAADISITQGNFRLLYLKGGDGVVVGFTDKEGNHRQYSKKIERGELDFLFEK